MAPLQLAVISMAQETVERPASELPGIVTRGSCRTTLADIAIDEAGRCIGATLRLRERAVQFSQRQQ